MSAQADQQGRGRIEQILAWLRRLEDGILVLLLMTMIGVAASQVILRNFFDAGLYWGDSLVRVTVLWVALVGAMVASRDDSHIRIDLLSRMVKPEHEHCVLRLTRLFTCLMLVLFTWGSGQFVYYEYVDNAIAFGDVPAWICEIIMPISGGVMALRYFLLTVKP
ncbi:MAG: TRAP transporter small permease [Pseudomonadota bacterium]|nr:TRAP transporter small permease [Pseudomonadota bacterium]MEC8437170.1 TRAP transporter small permease [Pseudomonadota bacterium]MEC8491683.1 TRAP transporter small permease [Pseudomonadota bacterium]